MEWQGNWPLPGATTLYEWLVGEEPSFSFYYTTNRDGSGICLGIRIMPAGEARLLQDTLPSDAHRTGNTLSLV